MLNSEEESDVGDRVPLQDLPGRFASAFTAKETAHVDSIMSRLETMSSEDWQRLLRTGQGCHDLLLMVHTVVLQGRRDARWKDEGSTALELLGDYLDLVVVPMVLKRTTLREEAMQCPCGRCSNALQAIHHLQDRSILTHLHEADASSFLGFHLEEAAASPFLSGAESSEKISVAAAAAGSLAVLAASARLQENSSLYTVPPGVVRSLAAVLQLAASLRHESTHSLALSLHVLRNVAANYQEVMDTSADTLRDCFQLLFEKDQDGCCDGNLQGRQSTDSVCSKSAETGNPQESDECASAEGLRAKDPDALKEAQMPVRSFRSSERLGLLSVLLQALFQSQDALQSLSISEEEIRQEVIRLASDLRAEPLKRPTRMAFLGIQLYLLICRSSHARRQYAILELPVLEAERRTVAFLLSTSTSQHCVLLQAMAQDVHSWLLWQSQAFAKQAPKLPKEEMRKRRSHKSRASRPPLEEPKASENREEVSRTPDEGSPSPPRVGLFTDGEAVWMAHSLLVAAFAVCLLVYWSSLEHTPASQVAARNGQLAG